MHHSNKCERVTHPNSLHPCNCGATDITDISAAFPPCATCGGGGVVATAWPDGYPHATPCPACQPDMRCDCGANNCPSIAAVANWKEERRRVHALAESYAREAAPEEFQAPTTCAPHARPSWCGVLLHFEAHTARCGETDTHGLVQCSTCFALTFQRANLNAANNTAPQNNARPPTVTTPWQRMGIVSLVNFQTEEAIEEVFTRLDIEAAHRTIYRTPSGSLRATGVLWNRRPMKGT